jgi:DNA polymerase
MTDIITVDWETYYSKDIGFSKLTTEEYIRHPEFEEIGVAVKVNDGPTEWASGTYDQLKDYLAEFDWENSLMLAHNTQFDGAIMNWRFGIKPKGYLDTLSMARAVHGVNAGGSLKKLAERYKIGEKGTEVVNALGKRRLDFTDDELSKYGDYCINDVELTHKLFCILGNGFPLKELKLIDLTLRMFVDPILKLDGHLLMDHLQRVTQRQQGLLTTSGFESRDMLMSNNKFAQALRDIGVEPPMKTSPRTGKQTYAFAKTDEAFLKLQEHDNLQVQTLVATRLGVKSTLEQTRTRRFLRIAERGSMPVPIRYYAAHTGRWGGDDKINLQNLPSRGPDAKTLKRSIMAPEGMALVDCDASQIEARVLAWLAGQNDLVRVFTNGEDPYVDMAAAIYNVEPEKIDKQQRFIGKTTLLGCGYGMGAVRFQEQLKSMGTEIELEEASRIIRVYRSKNRAIVNLWRTAGTALESMLHNRQMSEIDVQGLLKLLPEENGILLPSGMKLCYEGLNVSRGDKGPQYAYKTRYGETRIYGGKCIENWTQAVARCIIGEQMLLINKRYRPVLTVHDSIVCAVPVLEVAEAKAYIEQCMRTVPDWAEGLPIDCEAFAAVRYGDCYEESPALVA